MTKKLKIKIRRPWIGYPGSSLQQNYAESIDHGYLLWDINDHGSWDVNFHKLPNPNPFVTIDWSGSVDKTLIEASKFPIRSRFRIRNKEHITHKDVTTLTSELRQKMQAIEVMFKNDHVVNKSVVNAGSMTLAREDLRSSDVLLALVKEFHKEAIVSEQEWEATHDLIKAYIAHSAGADEIVRNAKWSLRHLKFDNLFSYGESNVVNFAALNGIIGIFGVNRIGKSSIIGTLMYALYNSTDRGSIKNLHVVNARKSYCKTSAIINVSGTDYVIERQTTKQENRKGQETAATALNVYRINEHGEADDLAGEQRTDTEKVIRRLIGTSEDFMLTSLSAQGKNDQFIQEGSAKRQQVLSRFLDLDVFSRMYDLANDDIKVGRSTLRNLPDREWSALDEQCNNDMMLCSNSLNEKINELSDAHDRLTDLRNQLSSFKDFTPVTKSQLDVQRVKFNDLVKRLNDVTIRHDEINDESTKINEKIKTIDDLKREHDLPSLKRRLDAYRTIESSVVSLLHTYEKESAVLAQQQRSLKILDDVPCGDKFQTCKFIKDAHSLKSKVEPQRIQTMKALNELKEAKLALNELKKENLLDRVQKIEQLNELHLKLNSTLSTNNVELVKLDSTIQILQTNVALAKSKLAEFELALKNEENVEVVSIRSEIDSLILMIKKLDGEKLMLASERGKIESDIEKYADERQRRDLLLQKMKAHELIAAAFSKKGIPNAIVTSQLPVINDEIAKILHGIVDFSIELETDNDSDSMEIYINYGDSRRVIELCSGMEKMIASIAIRVAMINVSSLPKTDMFIIDEGFGSLDDGNLEAISRLLQSLKRYFRLTIVISHIDAIKDVADQIIEITKNEKDTRVLVT
jgi:DNA repair exonuclease SbcCD ATPase subunit